MILKSGVKWWKMSNHLAVRIPDHSCFINIPSFGPFFQAIDSRRMVVHVLNGLLANQPYWNGWKFWSKFQLSISILFVIAGIVINPTVRVSIYYIFICIIIYPYTLFNIWYLCIHIFVYHYKTSVYHLKCWSLVFRFAHHSFYVSEGSMGPLKWIRHLQRGPTLRARFSFKL